MAFVECGDRSGAMQIGMTWKPAGVGSQNSGGPILVHQIFTNVVSTADGQATKNIFIRAK